MRILLYSEKFHPRLHYICRVFFELHARCEWEITTDTDRFEASSDLRINYSSRKLKSDCIHIYPHELLFENNIREQTLILGEWKNDPVFFMQKQGDIPFDIFAASFFLISRYEEYLHHVPDEFGRYPVSQSVAYRHGFLNRPLVDEWIMHFMELISAYAPGLQWKKPDFKFIPTFDIDIAYMYRGKGWFRNTGAALRHLVRGQWRACRTQMKVLWLHQEDPYDVYPELDQWHDEFQVHPIYFILMGRGSSLDRNLNPTCREMLSLLGDLKLKYKVGIHPSVRSHEHFSELQREVNSLQTDISRQHYIKFTLPETYRNLIKTGITADYSMGYGSANGFRASTAIPFPWFDLEAGTSTPLMLYPFCFMDCNSKFEQGQDLVQTENEFRYYLNLLLRTGGTFISIFHNFALSETEPWQGWHSFYQRMLAEVRNVSPAFNDIH